MQKKKMKSKRKEKKSPAEVKQMHDCLHPISNMR